MAEYHVFTPEQAMRFADEHSNLFGDHSKLTATPLNEGKLNAVYRIANDKGTSLIVKQALPFTRSKDDNWPLNTDRARIEAEVLRLHARFCAEHTVEVRHFAAEYAAILMEDLKQYQILRTVLLQAKPMPHLASQMASYLAKTLFYTSDFVLTGPAKKAALCQFNNPDTCLITEDLCFTDPYCNHERNLIHSPTLEQARALWQDEALQAEVASLKADFLAKPQALIHGDLHTGSIFINDNNCKVFDAEFGFYGPMGFDIGMLLGNLCLNYIGSVGFITEHAERQAHQHYVRGQIAELWQQFAEQFTQLMQSDTQDPMLQNTLYQQHFLQQVFADSLGYAGCELIRRSVGMQHVADLQQISDKQLQANCEIQAIILGKKLILQRHSLQNMEQVLNLLPI